MAKRKNPAAVALGRLGGKVCGVPKGFAALGEAEMSALAKKAAAARWGKKKKKRKQ